MISSFQARHQESASMPGSNARHNLFCRFEIGFAIHCALTARVIHTGKDLSQDYVTNWQLISITTADHKTVSKTVALLENVGGTTA
ncbi:hypothetical protein PoB_004106100 [Plakobranchus ocellatus]|uniref:Uncharacterized protein n=1 Tax=Plakobranchus ocellatus TaxID=259542 RepID=A0AAV4B216_9GAST|nr:hypothetical protein PoB_004106100 [Plakobranchus ocellatus]